MVEAGALNALPIELPTDSSIAGLLGLDVLARCLASPAPQPRPRRCGCRGHAQTCDAGSTLALRCGRSRRASPRPGRSRRPVRHAAIRPWPPWGEGVTRGGAAQACGRCR